MMTVPESVVASRFAAAVDRRSFLRRAGGIAAMMAAIAPGGALFFDAQDTEAAVPLPYGLELDLAILNFALNLEYLEGEYYNLGAFGQSLEARGIDTGGAGALVVKSSPKVNFTDPALQQYVEEIANDEAAHIQFLRSTITALGGTPVGRPDINLLDSFNIVSNMAGLGPTFDPFANEANFYVGGLSLSDVGVTAYKGAAGLLTDKNVISSSAGLLAVEAYHSSTLRMIAYELGQTPTVGAISNLRDAVDDNNKKDKDQGLVDANGNVNIFPTNPQGLTYGRTARQVLNIVYGGYKASKGLFFPAGVNGVITS